MRNSDGVEHNVAEKTNNAQQTFLFASIVNSLDHRVCSNKGLYVGKLLYRLKKTEIVNRKLR